MIYINPRNWPLFNISPLLVVEAKKNDKGITVDHISQAKSYVHDLLSACYVVSNGQQIKVYQFNGMLAPDDCVIFWVLQQSLLIFTQQSGWSYGRTNQARRNCFQGWRS